MTVPNDEYLENVKIGLNRVKDYTKENTDLEQVLVIRNLIAAIQNLANYCSELKTYIDLRSL